MTEEAMSIHEIGNDLPADTMQVPSGKTAILCVRSLYYAAPD